MKAKGHRSHPRPIRHPIAPGTRVTIFSILVGRRPFIEGTAEIVRPLVEEAHFYEVRFTGERHVRRRFVHPEFQADPESVHAALLREWRSSTMNPDLLRDFDLPREPKRRGTKSRPCPPLNRAGPRKPRDHSRSAVTKEEK
jgi:hypothetical protein